MAAWRGKKCSWVLHRSYWMSWTSIRWCSDGTSCLTLNPWSVDLHPLLCLVDLRRRLLILLELERIITRRTRTKVTPFITRVERDAISSRYADLWISRSKQSRANVIEFQLLSRVAPSLAFIIINNKIYRNARVSM